MLKYKVVHPSWIFTFFILFAGCVQKEPAAELYQIFSEARQFQLKENPLFATYAGLHTSNARMPSVALEDITRRDKFWQAILSRLEAINYEALSKEDKINYRVFRRIISDRVTRVKYKDYLMPLNADSGFHTGLSRLYLAMPFKTVKDFEDYISRLNAFPRYFLEHITLMKEGIKTGITVPKVVLEGYEVTIATHIVDAPELSAFYQPFNQIPPSISGADQKRLKELGRKAVINGVVKAYRSFLDFFVNEYRPNARTTLGASELPDGKAYYENKVRQFTTLDLTPEEVHQIGLKEVTRIRSEMEAVIAEIGFEGSFADFLEFLRSDPQFYAETPEELLKEASFITKRMDAKLPSLFKTLPRLTYGVAPVPDDLAPKYTGGRYVGPAEGSNEPGYYWVNTYKLDVRPLYNLEALSFHEAVPGHHLQNSIAAELENVPDFRRDVYLSAFGEGWGLYSEWLGKEAGFYTDPYSNFGRLTYEMWRACRLVVDTGIHAMGWERQQVIDYLASNTALPLHECTTETDRYISWPGQALSYKIGELKIKELRRYAEKELGRDFDVREFHDAVLWNGAVPLDVLEELIKDWVGSQKN